MHLLALQNNSFKLNTYNIHVDYFQQQYVTNKTVHTAYSDPKFRDTKIIYILTGNTLCKILQQSYGLNNQTNVKVVSYFR